MKSTAVVRVSIAILMAASLPACMAIPLEGESSDSPDSAYADETEGSTQEVQQALSTTYTPPPTTGRIYTVIRFKWSGFGTNLNTYVGVQWGSWSYSGTITPVAVPATCGVSTDSGIVLELTHRYPDTYPVTITTDGTFKKSPYQGSPPAEWNNSCYKRVSW